MTKKNDGKKKSGDVAVKGVEPTVPPQCDNATFNYGDFVRAVFRINAAVNVPVSDHDYVKLHEHTYVPTRELRRIAREEGCVAPLKPTQMLGRSHPKYGRIVGVHKRLVYVDNELGSLFLSVPKKVAARVYIVAVNDDELEMVKLEHVTVPLWQHHPNLWREAPGTPVKDEAIYVITQKFDEPEAPDYVVGVCHAKTLCSALRRYIVPDMGDVMHRGRPVTSSWRTSIVRAWLKVPIEDREPLEFRHGDTTTCVVVRNFDNV